MTRGPHENMAWTGQSISVTAELGHATVVSCRYLAGRLELAGCAMFALVRPALALGHVQHRRVAGAADVAIGVAVAGFGISNTQPDDTVRLPRGGLGRYQRPLQSVVWQP